MEMKKKVRETENLHLATCWMAFGAKFESVDRTNPKRQEFTFSTVEDDIVDQEDKTIKVTRGVDMDLIEKQLANNELLVNASDLFSAFQRMKTIIHSR